MRKIISSIFLILGITILVSTASAGINITDAEAIYEANFSNVDVPVSPAPVNEIFFHLEETTFEKSLSSVSVPAEPSSVNEIFLHLEETTFEKSLSSVSIPTEPSPVNEIFLHLEEAKTCEDLIHPTGLINDTRSPAIKNVTVTNATDNSATIKWDTDKAADSLVKYGITSGDYTHSKSNPLFVTNHIIKLDGLSSSTRYYFVVNSSDRSGNSAESLEYHFTATLDTSLPLITIDLPVNNATYPTSLIKLNYSTNEPTVWEGYSLDEAPNVTIYGNTTLTSLIDGLHILTVYANDTAGNMNSSTVWFTIDATPPSNIFDLLHTAGITWLNFTWTNPPDPDFNHTELYLNGTFLTNIPAPQNYYNITGLLPDTSYELSTHTVDINGNINFTWVNDTASTLPASGTTLNLYTGWNLISLPLMPEDTSMTSLLSPINGNYSIVWEYNASDTSDHWKKYDLGVPFGNDLTNMEPGKGYWIMMTSDDTLLISGTVPESTDLDLKISWNLIGFNSLDSQPIAEALSSINGKYSIVWAYDASDTADHWKKFDPGVPFGNDLINMEPGRGYWIMMTSEGILNI